MKYRLFQGMRIPSLLLAGALQVMPIVRAALPVAESATISNTICGETIPALSSSAMLLPGRSRAF